MQEGQMYQHDPNSMNPQGGFAAPAFTGQSWDGQHSQHPSQYGPPPGQDPRAYAYQQQMAPPEYGSMGAPPPPYGGQPAASFQQGGQPPIGMGSVRGSTFRTTGGSSAGGHSSVDGGASRFNGHPGGFAPATNLKFTQVQAQFPYAALLKILCVTMRAYSRLKVMRPECGP
jgi:hypothetical protein